MRKKYLLIAGCILLFGIMAIIASKTLIQKDENLEYRTEKEPLTNRFQNLPDFSECYWKADTIGPTNFGPTNYWMRGFLCLDEKAFHEVLDEYKWESTNIIFPDGIDPSITSKNEFNWCISKRFEEEILKQKFVGNFFLDTTNGVVYFDVENN